MQSQLLAQPRINKNRAHQPAVHIVNAHSIPHKSHLGQVSQLRPLPPQFIKDTAVKGLLLRTATTQFAQVGIIQTGPILCKGLCTVPFDLPIKHRVKGDFDQIQICRRKIIIIQLIMSMIKD